MTPVRDKAGIEPETFGFVDECSTTEPTLLHVVINIHMTNICKGSIINYREGGRYKMGNIVGPKLFGYFK